MKFHLYLNEQKSYNNWVNYTPQSLKEDFAEYKKKEDKNWKNRSQSMGFRFPIFKDFPEFTQALKTAQVKKLFKGEAERIPHVSLLDTIDSVKDMVGSYKRPRNVDRIVSGFESNAKMPMPIILKGKNGKHIMAGNTRLNVAYVMDIIPQVMEIDVTK